MNDGYNWLRNIVGHGEQIHCPVCGTPMIFHSYGAPLKVCPQCFPDERGSDA